MTTKLKTYSYLLFILLFIEGCTVMRYVPENERLYTGGSIALKAPDGEKNKRALDRELEELLRPKPNKKILGRRVGLMAHYLVENDKDDFVVRFINKKIGEEPVYLSDVKTNRTEELIENRLENRGYFKNYIKSEEKIGRHTAQVKYSVEMQTPYKLREYILSADSLPIYKVIAESMEKTLLDSGSRFDLYALTGERERIDTYLKSQGYYNFSQKLLIFEADTNQIGDKNFNLYLRLKKDVPHASIIPYEISSLTVYPNYSVDEDAVEDTVMLDSTAYVQEGIFFKPNRLSDHIVLAQGQGYDPTNAKFTSRRLSSLNTYKYVNIDFEEQPIDSTSQQGFLDTKIYLSPLSKRAVRAELQAVMQSNNFTGPALSLTYSDRNLFAGGEKINVSAKVGYEAQVLNGSNEGLTSTQLGGNVELIFPRLIFPGRYTGRFKYSIPKTKVAMGMDFLDRSSYYRLISYLGTFGYAWQGNRRVFHQINPISINYVNLTHVTSRFQDILDENTFLKTSFEQQFIAGLTYTFVYNELVDSKKPNALLMKVNVDIAGNMVDLFAGQEDGGSSDFLGLAYAQYAKIDMDIQNHYRFGRSQVLVGRVFGGVGYAYGNSVTMPYSKQFFSGGPYSVRAFRIRSLGPGTTSPDDAQTDSFFDQSGDIRIEANVEHRFPLISFLKGAWFVDAGNVWLIKENDELPGGRFSSQFLSELAVGAGVGLRVDLQGFVIRLDLATPLKNPSLPAGERLTFDLRDSILNFAIGYSF
ncbi:BamA/TamA family outer membrane protein [Reichenbachiella agariperforans]|uniref:translocation and assembly module lipoprotein TamL n=1 Tax=Reichenbachiella agariperforans TaxID=156994 RepID=UPI001C08C2A0|nr:BamA/TamA family outer membrane protein [Reichenbachiella agariperforans]MBU2914244.1 outer membrane protein assembly factor [Reichenbachiella agariperforans]